jgi:translocator protein
MFVLHTAMKPSSGRQLVGWILWVGVSLGAGQVGNLLGGAAESALYEQLRLPGWAPPGWLFGPVWIVLYVMMGTAAFLVWRVRGFGGARWELGLFLVHLVFNAAWTGIFFGLERFGLAFAEIAILLVLLGVLVFLFGRVRAAAGALLVPYFLWVGYATALTFAIWRLNP